MNDANLQFKQITLHTIKFILYSRLILILKYCSLEKVIRFLKTGMSLVLS